MENNFEMKTVFLIRLNYPRLFDSTQVEMSSQETSGHSVKNKNTEGNF